MKICRPKNELPKPEKLTSTDLNAAEIGQTATILWAEDLTPKDSTSSTRVDDNGESIVCNWSTPPPGMK